MTKRLRILLLIAICALTNLHLFSQQQADTVKKERVDIEYADHAIYKKENGIEISTWIGNVVLYHDSVYLYCDTAITYDRNVVYAMGNVIIRKGDSLAVFADSLDYRTKDSRAILTGEVVLKHKDQQLWTTQLEYLADSNFAFYNKGAALFNDSIQLTSKRGHYWTDREEARFMDSVVVIGEDFSMVTDSLHYDFRNNLVTFLTQTIIKMDEARIYCEDGYYDIRKREALFSKNAQFVRDKQRASAEQIIYNGDKDLIELVGNANFVEEDLIVTGDRIKYYQETGETVIIGNAFFRDSTRRAEGNIIYYNRETVTFHTEGRSRLIEGAQSIEADSIFKSADLGVAVGNAILQDTSSGYTMISDSLRFQDEDNYFEAFSLNRRPMYKTLLDKDTLFMTAERFVSFILQDTLREGDSVRQFRAYHDVRIFSDNLQGLCDSLSFNSRDSVFRMLHDPILWSDTSQFTADTILVYLEDGKLGKAELLSNALIIQELQQVFYNQIRGKYIETIFDSTGADPESVRVKGNAESIYYVTDREDAFIGVNEIKSAQIRFFFLNREIDSIHFSGKPTGGMQPVDQIDHKSLRLEGFEWLETKRPKHVGALY